MKNKSFQEFIWLDLYLLLSLMKPAFKRALKKFDPHKFFFFNIL